MYLLSNFDKFFLHVVVAKKYVGGVFKRLELFVWKSENRAIWEQSGEFSPFWQHFTFGIF
jgi:hypothetical protein